MDHNKAQDVATIADLEASVQNALETLRELHQRGKLPAELRSLLALAPQEGTSVHVSLRQRDSHRQIRRSNPASTFVPRYSGVWIIYEAPKARGAHEEHLGDDTGSAPLVDFVTALDHAEKDPHLQFISLKWFRDTYLAKRGYPWANDPDIPRQLTQEMTDRGLILTSKVPNPKSPEFPVTSIRLNRSHPEVQRIIGQEPLSAESGASG